MKYVLKLYVIEDTSNGMRAIRNLKKITEMIPQEDVTQIEVIDILKNPELAIEDCIVATPTLIKAYPFPPRRVIGDLSNTENGNCSTRV
ncbi:MAG TPA: circadian clock KaiB family protein [Thermodesulfovibrionia bacterium]|nr:circadian clock KaiB family protein [Thermodesulfovibrionia bacterium]